MAIKIVNYSTDPRLSSVDIYGNTNLVIPNIVTLRTTEPSYSGQIITVLGHTTAGIGGGLFRYDASDTTTADDNGITIVTSGGKRWKRFEENSVSPEMFGDTSNPDIDHSAIVQTAINYAAINNKSLSFISGRIYNLSDVRLTNRSTPWYVYGNGCIIQNLATETSNTPCLYSTCLASPGGNSRVFPYGVGVYLYNIRFRGENYFGIGYKHIVDGSLHVIDCTFRDLERDVVTSGVSNARFIGCSFRVPVSGNGICVFMARIAEDPYSINYTAEGPGWNDGFIFDKCTTNGGDYGYYFSGSTSEGVLTIRNNINVAHKKAIVFARTYHSLIYESNWTEFFDSAECNMIHLAKDTSGYEAIGTAHIRNNHFYNGSGDLNYVIFNENRRCIIENNHFQLTSTNLIGLIWNNAGASGNFTDELTLTPTRTTSFASLGKISFANTDLLDNTRDLYYCDDGNLKVILSPTAQNTPSGSTEFTMYKYTPIYPLQYPKYGSNWLNVTNVKNIVKPIGYAIDYDNPLIGETYSGNPVELRNGIDANDWNKKPTMIVRSNIFIGNTDINTIYQQREFGTVQYYDNLEQ